MNRLSRVHERSRQTDDRQTDGRAIAYSEREREFTFAKNARLGRKVNFARGKILSGGKSPQNVYIVYQPRRRPKIV